MLPSHESPSAAGSRCGTRARQLIVGVLGLCCGFSALIVQPSGAASANASSTLDHAVPGYTYAFPRDHGAHETYGLEWWYVTGHVYDRSARRFGYEVTFFRKAIDDQRVTEHPSRWALRQVYVAHLALTDVQGQTFHFSEKLSRAAFGKAGAHPDRMKVWIDRWRLEPVTEAHHRLRLTARDSAFGVDLLLTLQKPPVIHGREGISRKGAAPGQASHYYSLTRLATTGTVWMNRQSFVVHGTSWMDHEFGSGELGRDQVGWDWFSLQLASNMELMVYLLRKTDGSADPTSSGTLIFQDGTTRHLTREEIKVRTVKQWVSPRSHAQYPAEWVLEVPANHMKLAITPVLADQELRTTKSTRVTYWEGAVDVQGQYRGAPMTGHGYVELTGYAKPLKLNH